MDPVGSSKIKPRPIILKNASVPAAAKYMW